MSLPFSKYEGLGNDFLVVEAVAGMLLEPSQVARLCDRHRGVGADGVLFVSECDGVPRMDVINADGSVPEMCGNGIRCVALHLLRSGRALARELTIDTAAGPHACRVLGDPRLQGSAEREREIEVAMRPASLLPAEIGLDAEAPWVDAALAIGESTLRVTAVSMGNPHAVTFDEVGERRALLGPLLGKHPSFARGVNAGFARVRFDGSLELAVYERGAGWTEACGTGACAAAVAAVETGRAARATPLRVELPGGVLTIVVPASGERVLMTGPARHVFDGSVTL
jgi:diaminopimelate epimerase